MESVTEETTTAAVGSTTRIPWGLWCSALAVTSAYLGGYWDIAWHRSIGRDSFGLLRRGDLCVWCARWPFVGVPRLTASPMISRPPLSK